MEVKYVAYDGSVFDTQAECEDYESTTDYHNYITQYNENGEIINTNDWNKVKFIKCCQFPSDTIFDIFLEDVWNSIGEVNFDNFSEHFCYGPGLYQWDYESGIYVKVLKGVKNITW